MRTIIGTTVLASTALTYWGSGWWLLLTTFIGLNLFQSGLTGLCLLEDILNRFKIGEA